MALALLAFIAAGALALGGRAFGRLKCMLAEAGHDCQTFVSLKFGHKSGITRKTPACRDGYGEGIVKESELDHLPPFGGGEFGYERFVLRCA
jgi:hypothetical protein